MGPKIAVTGSIGGLKPAAAYVVLVQELEARGYLDRVIAFAGSSGSAPWAALAAAGIPADMMEHALLSIDSKKVWEDWNRRRVYTAIARSVQKRDILPGFTGIMEGHKIREWMRALIGRVTFEDLPKTLYVPAFDINRGVNTMFGPWMTYDPVEVACAVRASTAIPFAFRHETIAGAEKDLECGYWDGGVGCTIPLLPLVRETTHLLRPPIEEPFEWEMPDLVIALDAAGVMDGPQPKPWVSIDDLGTPELVERALDHVIDLANHLSVRLAQQIAGPVPVCALDVRNGAAMSDPAGTIPLAFETAKEDVPAFLEHIGLGREGQS
jgi:predicted acylesterase/phospholipase RssA